MKKIISCFLLLVVAIIIPFSSCTVNSGGDITSAEETPASPESSEPDVESLNDETTEEKPLFLKADPNRTDLPSLDVLYQIQLGMSMREVYEIAGSPHRIVERREPGSPTTSSTFNATYYVYDSSGDYSIYIFFSRMNPEPHAGVSRLIRFRKDRIPSE